MEFYVWTDGGDCLDKTSNILEAIQWARQVVHDRISDVVTVQDADRFCHYQICAQGDAPSGPFTLWIGESETNEVFSDLALAIARARAVFRGGASDAHLVDQDHRVYFEVDKNGEISTAHDS